MKKIYFYNRHLIEIGENYFAHFSFAAKSSIKLMIASFILIIHAILPFIFIKTGSNYVKKIHNQMQDRAKKLNLLNNIDSHTL
jgi:hypothetical protein